MTAPFWKTKSLEEMNHEEWESLCDRCGLCCVHKLEDEETGDLHFTCVSCRLLDTATARCTNYNNRFKIVKDCMRLTPAIAKELHWLPPTCAYRKVAEGKNLSSWHHLVSGSFDTVHTAGISTRNRVVSEDVVPDDKFEDFIADWIVSFEDEDDA